MIKNLMLEERVKLCAKRLYTIAQERNIFFSNIRFEDLLGNPTRKFLAMRSALIYSLHQILEEKVQTKVFTYIFAMNRASILNILNTHQEKIQSNKEIYEDYCTYYYSIYKKSDCMVFEEFKTLESILKFSLGFAPYLPPLNKGRSAVSFILLPDHEESMKMILDCMARAIGHSVEEVISKDRTPELVVARTAIAIRFLRMYPLISFAATGFMLGERHRTTILHLIQVYNDAFDPKNNSPWVIWYRYLVVSLLELPLTKSPA